MIVFWSNYKKKWVKNAIKIENRKFFALAPPLEILLSPLELVLPFPRKNLSNAHITVETANIG